MSNFSRKVKRKEVVQTTRQNKKKVKAIQNIVNAGETASQIIRRNEDRISEYSHCRVLPALTYAMKRVFGWGATRLAELSKKVVAFVRDYIDAGIKNGKIYITDKWLRDGLEDECNFVFPLYKRIKEPADNTSVDSWVAMEAKNKSIFVLECLETVFMWVLHTDYGFSAVRLKRFADEIRRIKPLEGPIKFVYNMMDAVERSKGRGGVVVTFCWLRETLKKLDVDRNDFAGGLIMLGCRKTV